MGGNLLVINVDIRETRVALVENGIIAELHIERTNSKSTLGNIYLGTVSRVLPGMQAAFIDVGQERAAFLHVEDLIRPDDLDGYLAQTRSALAGTAEEPGEEEWDDDEAPREAAADRDGRAPREGDGDDRGDDDRDDDDRDDDDADAVERDDAADDDDERDDDDRDDDDRDDDERDDDDRDDDERDDDDRDDDEDRDEGVRHEAAGDEAAADKADDDERDDEADDGDDDDADKADGIELLDDGELFDDDEPEDVAPVAGEARDERAAARGSAAPRQVELWGDAGATAEPGTSPSAEPAQWPELGVDPGAAVDAEPPESAAAGSDGSEPGEDPAPGSGEGGKRRARKTRVPRSGRSMRAKRSAKTPAAGSDGRRRKDNRPGGPSREGGGRRNGGRRGGGGRDGGRPDNRGRGRRGSTDNSKSQDRNRISKSTPIREVVREGQHVVVQVSKEPIGTKGARVTSHVSLPGRYVVYLPTVEHVGISKRIGSDTERSRLRAAIDSVKPPTGGLVVRTVAEGMTKKQLKTDVGYLVTVWADIARKREEAQKAPCLLYEELDLVLKTARDLFTDDVDQIVIDDREQYGRLRRFLEMFMPERVRDVKLYEGREPVFDAYGIEDEIGRALSRKVPLSSGGHLVIDQAEALTAIDVNTGRFVGKGSKDLEETILQTNLEAVEEIAYQLRFRNIGGLIILDLIDMERPSNREKVRRRLEELLARDKAKTTLNRISDLGLIEMTRKRTRESLGRLLHEPCFYCDGTGQLQSKQTIAYEIARQIRREMANLKGYRITVNAHPAIVDLLQHEEKELIQESERRSLRRIELVPRKEYHIEQFDLQGL